METQAFLDRLFERARAAGFKDFEVMVSSGDSFEATVYGGEIHTYDVSGGLELGLRAIVNGRLGIAATQIADEDAIEQLIEGARQNAELAENEDQAIFYAGGGRYPKIERYNPALDEISAAKKLDLALALEKAVLKIDPRVAQIEECGIFTGGGLTRILGSGGLDVSFRQNGAAIYVTPIARDGEKVNSAMRFQYETDFGMFDADKLAKEAVSEALYGLYAGPVASGTYEIVLRNDAAAQMIRTFFSIFSADAAQKGLSLLNGREGELIAASGLTLWDDPLLPNGRASAPFDGEGVPTTRKAVVENGRLQTLLYNLKTARKRGIPTTGNAARSSCAAPISIAPTNFYVQTGHTPLTEMQMRLGTGLVVTDVQGLHAGADAVSGDFSLSAKGYYFENGAPSSAVSGVTVAGNFYELLKNISMIGDDPWFTLPGISCVGSPSLAVGRMTVAGA